MLIQKQLFGKSKGIIYAAILVLFMMWLLNPYVGNNPDISSHEYYSLGITCLNDFEETTNNINYKLTNTYAKKVSKSKDLIFIRAQNQRNDQHVRIECIYDARNLLYLSINDQKYEL